MSLTLLNVFVVYILSFFSVKNKFNTQAVFQHYANLSKCKLNSNMFDVKWLLV